MIATTAPDTLPVVLVVEDNQLALDLRVEALSDAGCAPVPARSHAEALRALQEGPVVDLVLTDVNLGDRHDDRSGVTLARHVKRHMPDVPVVGYSAWFPKDALVDAIDVFDVFWTKGDLNFRAFSEMIEECRGLALTHRATLARSGPDSELDLLREQVDWLSAAVTWIEKRMVTGEGLEWKILTVLGALVALLAAVIGIALGLDDLLGP